MAARVNGLWYIAPKKIKKKVYKGVNGADLGFCVWNGQPSYVNGSHTHCECMLIYNVCACK
jgi:hypothetical protein